MGKVGKAQGLLFVSLVPVPRAFDDMYVLHLDY